MYNLFTKVTGVKSFVYFPQLTPAEANWVFKVTGVSLSQDNLSQKVFSPKNFPGESKAMAFFNKFVRQMSQFLCDWIAWHLEIILKETQKKKKEHDDLISSMSLSGLGKSTFRVDFGKEQLFPDDCYCLMRSVTTHLFCGINMAPCWLPKACWQLVVRMVTHFNTLAMF